MDNSPLSTQKFYSQIYQRQQPGININTLFSNIGRASNDTYPTFPTIPSAYYPRMNGVGLLTANNNRGF